LDKYLDAQGLPGTRQYDGTLDMGDSAAIYFNVQALAPKTMRGHELDYFTTAPVRHNDVSKWYGQPDRFSRDQLTPVLCWAALQNQGQHPLMLKVLKSHLKHALLFAWNTKGNGQMDMPKKTPDITGPEILGLYLRIYKPFGYQLLLPFLDLETLVNSIIWKFRSDRVTRNHMLVHITQTKVSPSFISKLSYKLNDFKDLVSRWEAHCAAVGEYPTADLFKKVLLER
jgi:hypothetical protein